MNRLVVVFVAVALVGCATPTDDRSLSRAAKKDCATAGGEVQRIGLLQKEACVFTYADAGNSCNGSEDCEGRCLLEDVAVSVGSSALGQCERDSSYFGCWAEVEGGVVVHALCVD